MGAHDWGLATVYQVENSFVRISNISPIFSHFKHVSSYIVTILWGKLVCRSLSRIAMITNIDFPVQTNFTIHAHIFAVYSCPRLHFIDPTNINRAKYFFHIFFQRAPILILKRIYWSISPQILTALSSFKLSGLNVEFITYTDRIMQIDIAFHCYCHANYKPHVVKQKLNKT